MYYEENLMPAFGNLEGYNNGAGCYYARPDMRKKQHQLLKAHGGAAVNYYPAMESASGLVEYETADGRKKKAKATKPMKSLLQPSLSTIKKKKKSAPKKKSIKSIKKKSPAKQSIKKKLPIPVMFNNSSFR